MMEPFFFSRHTSGGAVTVQQNVNPTEFLVQLVSRRLNGPGIRHIHGHRHGSLMPLVDRCRNLTGAFPVNVGDCDCGPASRHALREGSSQPTGTTRDQRNPFPEVE